MKVLRKTEVEKRVGYSGMHIWRMVRDKKFPAPLKLGPCRIGWLEEEIDDWIRAKVAERDKTLSASASGPVTA